MLYKTYYASEDMPEPVKECFQTFKESILNHIPENINCWVAGGAVRSFFENTPPNDMDVYFASDKDFELFKSWLGQQANVVTIMESEKHEKVLWGDVELDLMKKWFDTPEDSLYSFDFVVCSAAVAHDHLVFHHDFFMCLGARSLQLNNAHVNPVNTLMRMQKYAKYGYAMSPEEVKKLIGVIENRETDGEEDTANLAQAPSKGGYMINPAHQTFMRKVFGRGLKREQEGKFKKPNPIRYDTY